MRFSILALAATAALALVTPAQATIKVFSASMNGAKEGTPNASPGTGTATVSFNDATYQVSVTESWANLMGSATANHIHVATAPGGSGGVKLAFTDFVNPSPATGSYSGTFTLTSTNFNTLLGSTNAGLSYVNLHSTAFGGGEIRGFLTPVPEPTSVALMLGGLGLLGAVARRRRG
jgi:hypothetical protein